MFSTVLDELNPILLPSAKSHGDWLRVASCFNCLYNVASSQFVMYDVNGASKPLQQTEDDSTARPSPTAAVGGVRRLRDELNAALLDQQ